MDQFAASLSALPSFIAYFASGCVLIAVFAVIYSQLTPHREIALIRTGNQAAAVAFIGGLLGFVIPLASVIAHSGHIADLIVWGIVAMIVQLGGFLMTRLVFAGLPKAIENGQMSEAIFVAGLSLTLGILNAACMVG